MTVHSWVFRNRSRLRWIYGPKPEAPNSDGARLPALVTPTAGRVERLPEGVDAVLYPMPRQAS